MSPDDTYEAHKIFIFLPQEWSRRDKKLCGEKFQNIFPIFFFGKAHKIIFYYKSQHISGQSDEIAMCEISGAKNDGDFNANLHKNPFAGHRAIPTRIKGRAGA